MSYKSREAFAKLVRGGTKQKNREVGSLVLAIEKKNMHVNILI